MTQRIHDANGNELRAGDIVRIIGVPDLSGMAPECREESEPVFRCLVGKYKRIVAFDTSEGMESLAELQFRMKEDDEWHTHWVWIEPFLLKKKRNRSRT